MDPKLEYRDADTAEALGTGRTPTDRDREFSCFLHYMSKGRWPLEYPQGFFAVLPGGSPAELPKARMPKDWAVYSHLTGWRLEGEERLKSIEKREKQYEEHGTTERARLAVAAAALSSSFLTGSLAAQRQGKDRVQILQSAVEPYYEKDSSRDLQRENACLKITENARRAALDKIAPSLAYLAVVGYSGVAQLNRWIKVSTAQQIRPGANED
jgi:hypothetical protein